MGRHTGATDDSICWRTNRSVGNPTESVALPIEKLVETGAIRTESPGSLVRLSPLTHSSGPRCVLLEVSHPETTPTPKSGLIVEPMIWTVCPPVCLCTRLLSSCRWDTRQSAPWVRTAITGVPSVLCAVRASWYGVFPSPSGPERIGSEKPPPIPPARHPWTACTLEGDDGKVHLWTNWRNSSTSRDVSALSCPKGPRTCWSGLRVEPWSPQVAGTVSKDVREEQSSMSPPVDPEVTPLVLGIDPSGMSLTSPTVGYDSLGLESWMLTPVLSPAVLLGRR